MTKSIIFMFLILFLILMPVTAEEETSCVTIEFPKFYEGNFSGERVKLIGTVGIMYQGFVFVGSPNEEVKLTNGSLELIFSYKDIPKSEISEQKTTNREIFWYNKSYKDSHRFNVTFNLSEKLGKELCKGEYKSFTFDIAFLETGMYKITWIERIEQSEKCCSINSKFISIVEPIEWIKLTKQSQLLDAEKKSAEASEETAGATKNVFIGTLITAIVTAMLAGFTLLMVVGSYRTLKQIQIDREVDLLRRRLGNLYSMLKYNKDILNQKLPCSIYYKHPKYVQQMEFYRKFRENLYLGSDDLVKKAENFLSKYIDVEETKILTEESAKEFEKDKKELISQIDSDYDKYLERLIELTKKPKK